MKVLHINANYVFVKLFELHKKYLDEFVLNTVYAPYRKSRKRVSYAENDGIVPSQCVEKWHRYAFLYKEKVIFDNLISNINPASYDLVNAHSLFTDGYIAYKLKEKYGISYAVVVSNTDLNAFFKYRKNLKHIGIKILQKASAVIFISEAYRESVITKYVPKKLKESIWDKSYIIPFGIDSFWFENVYFDHRFDNDELNIVCVGAVNCNKNITSVIKAVEKLNAEGIKSHLDVAGRPENEKIIKKIQECKYSDYHGLLNREELLKLYRKNNIFVLPSHTETFGLVYAEAMSQGLPVIYTKGQGFDRQFADGTVGYAVDSHSVDDICDKIKLVWKNAECLSKNALGKVGKFEWEKVAEEYFKVYKNVVEK